MFGPGLDRIERNVLADESYNLMGAYTQELKPPSVRRELPGELKTYNIQERIGRLFFYSSGLMGALTQVRCGQVSPGGGYDFSYHSVSISG